jgi:hypothetical protein
MGTKGKKNCEVIGTSNANVKRAAMANLKNTPGSVTIKKTKHAIVKSSKY